MRKPPRLYAHDAKGMIPRMSWSPHNLYNLIARSTVPANISAVTFKRVAMTMYQQRWRSKRFLRGYHGDWIGERRFRRWYLPTSVPRLEQATSTASTSARQPRKAVGRDGRIDESARTLTEQDRMPVTSLFLREVERRLDTVVFRCCFARSAREARALIVQGKVKVNGVQTTFAGTLLNPGDLLSIEPTAVPMLSPALAKQAAEKEAKRKEDARQRVEEEKELNAAAVEEAIEAATEEKAEAKAPEEKQAEPEQAAEAAAEAESSAVEKQTTETDAAVQASEEVQEAAQKNAEQDKGKGKAVEPKQKKEKELAAGVLPFNLPPFAAPFLFVPPYLEVSFTTCSAIYMRHPTITPVVRSERGVGASSSRPSGPQQQVAYHTDLPSPYPATSEIFSLAWELYVRDAPRIRSDVRRLRTEARVGRNGLRTARARDQWRSVLAIRRKRDRQVPIQLGSVEAQQAPAAKTHDTQFVVGGQKNTAVRRKSPVKKASGNAVGLQSIAAEAKKAANATRQHTAAS